MNKYICLLFVLFSFNYLFGQTKPNSDLLEPSVIVVKVYDNYNNFLGYGSGVIIDSKGTCITCYHVLEEGYFVKVLTQQGDEFDMDKIVGENSNYDLIKFTIKNSNKLFTPIKISETKPKKGEDVWAMGTPDDIKNFNQFTHGGITNFITIQNIKIIQTDARIAHGSSGGGLFNTQGKLIGITGGKFKGEDATLAGRNIAIPVGYFAKLNSVNKDRLESSIPVTINKTEIKPEEHKYEYVPEPTTLKEVEHKTEYQATKYGNVSFWTNWSKQIDISIEYQSGSTHSFFKSGAPNCGQSGTVTFSLPVGYYSYDAIGYSNILLTPIEYTWHGNVTVSADNCSIVSLPRPVNENPSDKYLVIGTNFVNSFYFDKYSNNHKYRWNFLANHETNTCNKFGIDLERVYTTHNKLCAINFSWGPSIRYQVGSYNWGTQYNSQTGNLNPSDSTSNISNIFFNFRMGSEIIFGDRIIVHGSVGIGYSTQSWGLVGDPYHWSPPFKPSQNADYDFFVGYKFGVKHSNHYHKQSIVIKYAPQLILPGWTDYKLTSGKKGKFKMVLFLTSVATAIGSSIYSNSQYSKYTSGDPLQNTSHYNNANLAHKFSLVSSGLILSLYTFDIIHFCTKLKTIRNI